MITDTPGTCSAKDYLYRERAYARHGMAVSRNRGDSTGWHRHEYDYVIVPLFDGQLEINTGSGEEHTIAPMQNGVPYFREVGVEHDVMNGNDFECAFVEIEFLK